MKAVKAVKAVKAAWRLAAGWSSPKEPVSWRLTVDWSSPKGPVSCRQLQGMSLVCRAEGVGLSVRPDFLTCDGKWWWWGEIPKRSEWG